MLLIVSINSTHHSSVFIFILVTHINQYLNDEQALAPSAMRSLALGNKTES